MPVNSKDILKKSEKAFNSPERKNFETLWETVAEFIVPTQFKSFLGLDTKGDKKTRRIFDSTADKSNRDLAASIHSTLTNPATQWSRLRYTNEELNNDPDAVAWLQEANKRLHRYLNESQFDQEMSKFYLLFPALGTSVLFHEERPLSSNGTFSGFRFRAVHLSELAFSEDVDGKANIAYRRFPLTVRQAVERFGVDKLSDEMIRCVDTDPEKEFDFVHAVFPRDKKDVKVNSAGLAAPEERPFASVYIEKKTGELVEEGGYYEFPMYIVRWETMAGEIYGRGPGQTAIPDVRTLNKLIEHSLQQQAMALRPPILAQQRSVFGTLDLRPGSVGIVKDLQGVREFTTNARFDVAELSADRLMNNIRQIFFLDKLLLPPREETGEMTAFEVSQRIEQMQRVIGPTIARLNSELLQPLVIRAFRMLLRGGALPEIPSILQGADLDIDISFQNQLARSQQFEDVTNIQTWMQQAALMAQLKPEVVDYVDTDAAIKHMATIIGIPESVIANDKAVRAIREQRAKQQQAMQALDAGVAMADIQSKTGGGNAGQAG